MIYRGSSTGDHIRLELGIDLAELESIQQAVKKIVGGSEAGPDDIFLVDLALTEAFTNIVKHGYPEKFPEDRRVVVELNAKDGVLECKIEHEGDYFDLGEAMEKSTGAVEKEEQIAISGRGLQIITGIVDDFKFRREGQRNIAVFSKRITGLGEKSI